MSAKCHFTFYCALKCADVFLYLNNKTCNVTKVPFSCTNLTSLAQILQKESPHEAKMLGCRIHINGYTYPFKITKANANDSPQAIHYLHCKVSYK